MKDFFPDRIAKLIPANDAEAMTGVPLEGVEQFVRRFADGTTEDALRVPVRLILTRV